MSKTNPTAEPNRRDKALRKLLEHLRAQKPMNIGPWTREELYERAEEEKQAARRLPTRKANSSE
jgi:hypothetical protein